MNHSKESINFKIMCRIQICMKYLFLTVSRVFLVLSVILLCHCESAVDYQRLPAFAANGNLQAVIEISAGSSMNIEFNEQSGTFEPVLSGDTRQILNFLPYPGNYGFIPGTNRPAGEGHGGASGQYFGDWQTVTNWYCFGSVAAGYAVAERTTGFRRNRSSPYPSKRN